MSAAAVHLNNHFSPRLRGAETPASTISSELKPIAIHFGAGNIGRGFIGPLLHDSGFHIVFADVNEELIKNINEEGQWDVHVLDTVPKKGGQNEVVEQEVFVEDVSGVLSNSDEVIQDIESEQTEFITTAVGVNVLPKIAGTIAKGIAARCKANVDIPLNIVACENAIGATSKLAADVLKHLSPKEKEYAAQYVGWANCSIDRIVPPFESSNHSGLDVGVEGFFEWVVDKAKLKPAKGSKEPPQIAGMELTDDLLAFNERKLYTLNTGHAIAAYLGRLKGYKFISQAISDNQIRDIVQGALGESGEVLCRRHKFNRDEHQEYIQKTIRRFRNEAVKDDLSRVGRQPLRKLGREDRLVGPAIRCTEEGVEIPNLSIGIAAALLYEDESDDQSKQMREEIKEKGLEKFVEDITGFKVGSRVNQGIIGSYNNLATWKP